MADPRFRTTEEPRDDGERSRFQRDYSEGRTSARDYAAAGELGRGRSGYGSGASYGRDDGGDWNRGQERNWDRGYGRSNDSYGERYYGAGAGLSEPYGGSYGPDGRRALDYGDNRGAYDDNNRGRNRSGYGSDQYRGYRGRPEGYRYEDRGFFDRAGDEVRSWFGDEEAERRREYDARYDERNAGRDDGHYSSWRRRQIEDLDRDYAEYRNENAQRFDSEFGSWRTERQGQRTSLQRVTEHMEVVGSDGGHVGTVDKVRGDRIILTKNDVDAGGHHHSIPSRWIETVDDKVTIRKTADEAKTHWRDEERSGALFGQDRDDGKHWSSARNRGFLGTY